jgi:5-methylcytosine-specific restriction endonuclease McrA
MRRYFTRKERLYLAILAGFRCENCGARLPQDFHADHKVAFSKGGPTTLLNGQAFCAACNLKKGSRDGNASTP